MQEFMQWFGERTAIAARLAIHIILDAILFVEWLAIAWIVQMVADFFVRQGVHENFAFAFKWASSLGTVILTLLCIGRDIRNAWATLMSPPNTD